MKTLWYVRYPEFTAKEFSFCFFQIHVDALWSCNWPRILDGVLYPYSWNEQISVYLPISRCVYFMAKLTIDNL